MSKPAVNTRRKSLPGNINLRVKPHARALIDPHAVADKTATEFVSDAACREAADVLLDRQLFNLDATKYQAFVAALDAPTPSNPELNALLSRKPLWER